MEAKNMYKLYQEQSIFTYTQDELLILIYDETIKNIRKSIAFIKEKKISETHTSLIKSQNIVLHLIENLDMKYPVSKSLFSLYDFIYNQLIKANIEKNSAILEDILLIITDLRSAWQEASKSARISQNRARAI